MLSNIKVKFLNVSKNVKFLQNEKPKEDKSVNFDAGTEILDYFKKEWEVLHETNERNAEVAADVAEKITSIQEDMEKKRNDFEVVTDLVLYSNLPNNINNACNQIGNLFNLCNSIEEGLIELEDIIDQIEFENLKQEHEYHLKKYEEKKKENLRLLDLELMEKRRQELIQEEEEKSRKMQERQKVFQEAFRNDLELFKTLGQIPKVEFNKKQSSALLEEIQLDFDQTELEQFFEDKN